MTYHSPIGLYRGLQAFPAVLRAGPRAAMVPPARAVAGQGRDKEPESPHTASLGCISKYNRKRLYPIRTAPDA